MVGSEKKNSNQNLSRRLNNVVELLTTLQATIIFLRLTDNFLKGSLYG